MIWPFICFSMPATDGAVPWFAVDLWQYVTYSSMVKSSTESLLALWKKKTTKPKQLHLFFVNNASGDQVFNRFSAIPFYGFVSLVACFKALSHPSNIGRCQCVHIPICSGSKPEKKLQLLAVQPRIFPVVLKASWSLWSPWQLNKTYLHRSVCESSIHSPWSHRGKMVKKSLAWKMNR